MRTLLPIITALCMTAATALGDEAKLDDRARFVPPRRGPELSAADAAKLTARQARDLIGSISVGRDGKTTISPAADDDVDLVLRALRAQVDARMSKQVVGPDERQRVGETTARPFRSIAQIAIGCTGTIVGSRHVLTAAHCIYNVQSGRFYSRLQVTPARNGGRRPFGTVGWTRAIVPTGWTQRGLPQLDYGLIVLDRDVGRQTGRLAFASSPLRAGSALTISGYPGDKPAGTMWRSGCTLLQASSAQLFYPCDTEPGMSGSAVIAGGRLVGVHGYAARGQDFNVAARINGSAASWIERWIRAG